jgi:hypothetical protein
MQFQRSMLRISSYHGVPCPVTGFRPGLAAKPSGHLGLFPTATSLKTPGDLYTHIQIEPKKLIDPLSVSDS